MKRILYVPLDERPCNNLFPQMELRVRKDIAMTVPGKELLGAKKEAGDIKGLWAFVSREAKRCDAAVLSAEMLFYGGLLPSRLHHLPDGWKEECVERMRALRKENPGIRLYVFQLIMRTPGYNSGDEEPDYYEQYGERIFRRAWYLDKQERQGLSEEETEHLQIIDREIPSEIIRDYEWRRAYNLQLNRMVLELVEEGVIDFLSIPQDDSSEFGYTAKDQKVIGREIRARRLQNRVLMYPGADEAGCTLTARAVTEILGIKPGIYPFYASAMGPYIVPLYEDRCMAESLKAHVMAAGGRLCDSPAEAELILAINCPGKVMMESFDQKEADITYRSFRSLNWFTEKIADQIRQGKPVMVADCAYSNGGDLEFLEMLDTLGVLDRLVSYKGWNTHCNTLGSTLAQGILAYGVDGARQQIRENLLYHILDDGIYQAEIRSVVTAGMEGTELTYFDLKDQQEQIAKKESAALAEAFAALAKNTFRDIELVEPEVFHPWNRMFEIGLSLKYRLT